MANPRTIVGRTRPARFARLLIALTFASSLLTAPLVHAGLDERPGVTRARLAAEAAARGEEFRGKWKVDEAQAAFREAATLEPSSLDATLGLARVARVKLDYARAINLLDRASREHPNSVELLSEYGSVYLAVEEPARAKRYFESALRIFESHTPSIVGLAGVDLLDRNYDRATRSLRALLTRQPNSNAARAMLAHILMECGKTLEAGEEAKRALELDAYDVEALYTLACVRSIERKPDEARALARRLVSLDEFNIGGRRMLSQYLAGERGYDRKPSEKARARFEHGRKLKQEGMLEEAAAELEAALRVEPAYYRALIALGDVRLRQGECERAAVAAALAIEVDPDGALAQLELSCAYRGINERARVEIGAVDFAALFYSRPLPSAYALTREIFPSYGSLTRRQQSVIDLSVGPLAAFLPKLAKQKARHFLLAYDQRPSELHGFADVADEKTFDGRYYKSIRGVGGRVTVSGIEYLDQAARGGFNTIAHEFAHQVHIAALGKSEVKTIRKLYQRACTEERPLDYYAAANEYEYFAQGYEAFISERKRPSAGVTARHTNRELAARDPELYRFLLMLTDRQPSVDNLQLRLRGVENTIRRAGTSDVLDNDC